MAADRPPDPPRGNPYGLMVVGSEIVSFVVAGLLLDYLFKTLPWITVALTLLGFVAAFTHLLRMAKDLGKPPPRREGKSGGSATPSDVAVRVTTEVVVRPPKSENPPQTGQDGQTGGPT
jgi:hypothetical protein